MGMIRFALILPVFWVAVFVGMRLDYYSDPYIHIRPGKFDYFGCLTLKRAPAEWPVCPSKPCPPGWGEPWGCCWSTWRQRLFVLPNLIPVAGGLGLSTPATRFGQSQVTWFHSLTVMFVAMQWWLIGFAIDRRRRKRQSLP
jgi:hypothetical protein